jgi:ATP/maltotriose-dependent transcriptional regulator MalT
VHCSRIRSLPGYRYCVLLLTRGHCDLLLARGRVAEASGRAAYRAVFYKSLGSLLSIALGSLLQATLALAAVRPSNVAPQECAARSAEALAALRRTNTEHHLPRGLLAHAEALWRCGDADAAAEPLHEAEDVAARGPMPLFMCQAHLLRARIALGPGDFAAARDRRYAAAALIAKHNYGRGAVELAVLDAELAIAAQAADADKAIATAVKAVAGEPYRDERTGRTVSGGWFGLLPRLEAILPAGHAGLAQLQAARDAYNAERDDYLRSTLAEDLEGYDPADDPIAAYLESRERP